MSEHINATESHRGENCPGPDECACQRGLERVLRELDEGKLVIVQVQ